MPNILEATLAIKGMSCSGCVTSVTRVLDTVPGVEAVHVEIGRATVRIDTGVSTVETAREALTRAGYEATGDAG